MKIYKQTFFLIIMIIYLFLGQILSKNSLIFRYADEIITIIMFLYLFLCFITKKIRISDELKKVCVLCALAFAIGIISSISSTLVKNNYIIMLDALAVMKVFICSISMANILNYIKAKNIAMSLEKPAKILLVLGVIFSVVNQFVDINMRGSRRFGIWSFNFIFGYAFVYAAVILFLIFIIYSNEDNKKKYKYLYMAIFQMIITTKGPSIIWAVSTIIIIILMQKKQKISLKVLISIGIITILLGGYQITNYLTNSNSPRYLFYQYGVVTANRYFPLGSGYGTFGSDMAAKHYSPLYFQYRFDGLYGMSYEDRMYLNDNYWPMIYAQFGWFGLAIFMLIILNIFKLLQKIKIFGFEKAIIMSAFFYTILHSVGSSSPTAGCTILLYFGMIIFIKCNQKENNNE